MDILSPKRSGDDTPEPPRSKKRAKYTQVACNECKRRKLKCSGDAVCTRCARDDVECIYTGNAHAANHVAYPVEEKNDGLSTLVRAVDSQVQLLRREMRVMAARVRQIESSSVTGSTAPSIIPASGSTVSSSNNAGLQRIMNRPQSPSYVGPTSAEFGLTARQKSVDDSDGNDLASTAAASPAPPSDTEAMSADYLGPLGLAEALRLVTVYENTVGLMYPCVDLDSVRAYVAEYYRTEGRPGPTSPVTMDQDWFFARDVEVLKIILATALLAESHGRSERAAFLADSVEDRFATRVKIAEVDMKELLILTLLVRWMNCINFTSMAVLTSIYSIFHSYRDDEVISWRLIGMAVRGSMQLGLHCQETWLQTGGVFPGELQWTWASRLFWCIYVLDRKWSFGTGLPFAIQDSDMDTNLPEPGTSTPYLTCMITYARLSTKIWGLVVGWRSRPRSATSDYCSYLDFQVQQWIQSIPRELRFDPSQRKSDTDPQADNMMMLQVLLALQANQLRILVYRQNLLTNESIETNVSGATTAVETAKSSIHMLDFFSRVSDIYFQRPEPFNYFLISALAALFLAVLHSPSRFSQICRPEFYAAVDMVRKSSTRARTSRRLQKIIRSLKLIRLNLPGQSARGTQDHVNRRESHMSQRKAETTPLTVASPFNTPTSLPNHRQPPVSGTSTPQFPSSMWSFSPPPTAPDGSTRQDTTCEDLTSFFEMAGGLYFDPRTGGHEDIVAETGGEGLDAFHAEDEALTRVMAGLL